jgi:hypothetical protein
MNSKQLDQYLAKKPIESYPDYVKKEMKFISFYPKDMPISYGSYLYRFQRYASDIDLLQYVDYVDEDTTIKTFIKILKKIINSLDKDHIYSEFKAGLDSNYIIDIGIMREGIYTPAHNLMGVLYEKTKEGLFTRDEYDKMRYMVEIISTNIADVGDIDDTTQVNSDVYDYIYNLIRNKRILRWSAEEIMKGYKIISKDKKYTLYDAIQDETIVKIDLIVYLNNKFIEITNLILLTYVDTDEMGNEEHIAINISEEAIHNPTSLRVDIEKLYYSNKFYSPLKACKRMYGYMRAVKGKHNVYDWLPNHLIPVLEGDVSSFYQLKGEIDAILVVLQKKFTKQNLERAKHQLQDIKTRFNYIKILPDETVIRLAYEIDQLHKIKNHEKFIEELETLLTKIKTLVNSAAIYEMNKYGINPPPDVFLPNKGERDYDSTIIRKSLDDPPLIFKTLIKELEHEAKDFSLLKANK